MRVLMRSHPQSTTKRVESQVVLEWLTKQSCWDGAPAHRSAQRLTAHVEGIERPSRALEFGVLGLCGFLDVKISQISGFRNLCPSPPIALVF